jgi:putative endonuclease
MTYQRKQLGRQGEEAAEHYLKKKGYSVICRNYTCVIGEIDLIALDNGVLVFVEVRSRSSLCYGLAQESISKRKQHKLRQLAWYYLKAEGKTGISCRFDVIAVLFDGIGTIKNLDHITNAF